MKPHYKEYLLAASHRFLNIDVTNKCMLGCRWCHRSNKEEAEYMNFKIKNSYDIPLDSFRKLCDFFQDDIVLCGQISDPIFHPKLDELLKIMKDEYPDKRFIIATAANLRNIEQYKKLFELTGKNTVWRFGLDGLPDTSFIYRKRQNSQLVYDAMLLAASSGIETEWHYIIFNYNKHQIEQAQQIAQENNIYFYLKRNRGQDLEESGGNIKK